MRALYKAAAAASAALLLVACSSTAGTSASRASDPLGSPGAPSSSVAPEPSSSAASATSDEARSLDTSSVRSDADRFCATSGSTEHAIDLSVVSLDFTGDGGLDAVATFSCAGDDGVPRPHAVYWTSEDVPGSSPEEVFDTSGVEAIFEVTRQRSRLRFATFQDSREVTRTFRWQDGAWVGDEQGSDDLASGLVSGPDEAIAYLCNGEDKPRLVKVSSDPYATSVLQTVLAGGLVVDGRYGARTRLAVEAYQSDRGLTVDGLTGPQTWGDLVAVTCSGD